MSRELLDRSSDLKRLRDEGYEVAIRGNYVIVSNVPYVRSGPEIGYATLVANLDQSGDRTVRPKTHAMFFAGDFPCRSDGTPFTNLGGPGTARNLTDDLMVNFQFSQKPEIGYYSDYYEKFTRYIEIFEHEAKAVDPVVSAQTFRIVDSDEEDPIFNYPDTNSSRAEINLVTDKLRNQKIGIIGVGGTGSYVLDFLAKTPVAEIHLFDGDTFLAHNAFRSPGAATKAELNQLHPKAQYFADRYSNMRKHIHAHDCFLNADNLSLLDLMDFVFICIDQAFAKSKVIQHLESLSIPFIDVGMGLEVVDGSLIGIIRATTSTPSKRSHIHDDRLIPLSSTDDEDEAYSTNIQIAELNAMNAAMAVIKWKKLLGFYQDLVHEHHTVYSLNDNLYDHRYEA